MNFWFFLLNEPSGTDFLGLSMFLNYISTFEALSQVSMTISLHGIEEFRKNGNDADWYHLSTTFRDLPHEK